MEGKISQLSPDSEYHRAFFTIRFIMLAQFLAAVLLVVPFIGTASASPAPAVTSCAKCAPTIVFGGVTRTLTLAREEEMNTLQCNYDLPAISGFSPACLYANVNGALLFTNAGSSCPSVATIVTQTSPPCHASL
ncbi:hypothetical protein QCA50_006743 [Cerrena zonata]|uniref:Uncharacterized protein n=1 Tax=Cerrena zonata TaxID=2478898 RepID=A0AAW0GCE4_9APHY